MKNVKAHIMRGQSIPDVCIEVCLPTIWLALSLLVFLAGFLKCEQNAKKEHEHLQQNTDADAFPAIVLILTHNGNKPATKLPNVISTNTQIASYANEVDEAASKLRCRAKREGFRLSKMGCGGSTNSDKGQNSDDGQKNVSAFHKQPKVSIKVGDGVKMLEKNPRVVFVFGGPGTKKGSMIDNLANVFGMEVINVENVIISNLAKKVENPDPGKIVNMVKDLLTKEDHLLRLDSVLRMVGRAIGECDPNKVILVDLMPNLKWMLNNKHFIKECEEDLCFSKRIYAISFVLNFVIPKEKVLNKLEVECAKHPTTQQAGKKPDQPKQSDEADSSRTQKWPPKQSDEADSSRTQKWPPKQSDEADSSRTQKWPPKQSDEADSSRTQKWPPKQSDEADSSRTQKWPPKQSDEADSSRTQKWPPKQSDEADSSRTQNFINKLSTIVPNGLPVFKTSTEKRLILYENSIRHFMGMFEARDNIVSVDVSSGRQDAIWAKLCDFFAQYNFQSSRIVESVVIFGFDETDLEEVAISRYSLTVIKLKDILQDTAAPVEQVIDQLCQYLDSSDPTHRVFAVDSTDTSLTRDLKKVKSIKAIQFHESGEDCRMSRYCKVNLTNKGDPVPLQAVSSIHNEVCLFTSQVPPDLCKWVASMMAECRTKQRHS
ncbi:SANT-like protein [Mya arenaria]|uniref:SANT-like protein n=1 Tax=Mya arenaria TaxID=6604 RepID=A0ABY7E3N6_MYAAR|nr:SANT-like protein [Mya arenaria]